MPNITAIIVGNACGRARLQVSQRDAPVSAIAPPTPHSKQIGFSPVKLWSASKSSCFISLEGHKYTWLIKAKSGLIFLQRECIREK
jgi:hypothetical protein